MSYTGSKAQSGAATILNINTGTVSSPTWTLVGEVTDIGQSGKSNKTDDVTNLESTAEEFIPTLLSPGSFKVTMNRIQTTSSQAPADPGQYAMYQSFNATPPTILLYEIILPKSTSQTTKGDTYQFSALVEQMEDIGTIKPDKKISTEVTLKVSGAITLTAGS
jgi:hypothetical protein